MSKQIKFRVPDEWLPVIEKAAVEAGYELEVPKGRAGGISLFVKDLVAKAVGLEVVDPHAQQSKAFADKREKNGSSVSSS